MDGGTAYPVGFFRARRDPSMKQTAFPDIGKRHGALSVDGVTAFMLQSPSSFCARQRERRTLP
jgi:hypothetical protein